jgi:Trp operon repressor
MGKKYENELAQALTEINDLKVAKDFLSNMLTPNELEELVLRLQILKSLKAGIPQRKIAKDLNVSIGTVSRGSREVKYGKSKFIQQL